MSAINRESVQQGLGEANARNNVALPKTTPLPLVPGSSISLTIKDGEALLKHSLENKTLDSHLNPIFELLVESDNDVAGLLAYGLYKQNKRDWMIAFQTHNNRAPEAAELAAFILSEQIPRRIATYRRLAEDMLTRDGNKVSSLKSGTFGASLQPLTDAKRAQDMSAKSLQGQSPVIPLDKRAQSVRYILGMLALVVAMAVFFRLAGAWLFN